MTRSLPKLCSGEPVTSDDFNALIATLERPSAFTAAPPLEVSTQPGGVQLDHVSQSTIEFVRLDEDIEPDDHSRQATTLRHDAGASGDPWVDTARTLARLVDPQGGTYLEGERHACWFQADSGKYIPLVGVHFHLGVADEAIAPAGSGTVSIWNIVSEMPDDAALNVTAFDWTGCGIASGARVFLIQHPQSRRWYAIAQNASISQFSRTTDQTVLAPGSGTSRERIKFDSESESEGGANVNGRVVLTTSGSDQGLMEPAAGYYLVSAAGTLSVTRRRASTIIDATNASPIVVTTSNSHPFVDGDQVWLYNINGNFAANGFHVVDNSTSTTFELAGSTGSGTYSGTGSADTAVEVPVLVASGYIELRRKPSSGSWSSYRSSRFDFRFMPIHPDGTVVLAFATPPFEVTAEADDQFEFSIVVAADEDVTILSSGDFDPAGKVRVTWDCADG